MPVAVAHSDLLLFVVGRVPVALLGLAVLAWLAVAVFVGGSGLLLQVACIAVAVQACLRRLLGSRYVPRSCIPANVR